ncbi:MAG: DNA modification methylase [Cyanobacteria bacterium REEB65]|nr:DNA modification methylase [Cyanobacteria bacterium REEB65]
MPRLRVLKDQAAPEVAAVWVPIAKLQAWDKNPRKNDAAVEKVADSIRRFGFGSPILARRNGEVIAGHTRLKAALKLGIDRVPVRYLDLDPADARLLALADNKLGEIAEWDEALLAEILKEFDPADAAIAGFGAKEVADLLAEIAQPEAFNGDPDDAPELPAEPTAKPGDLWILGRHRLLCGDSTDAAVVARLMGGQQADMVFTDPPYNVDYVGKTKDALRIQNDAMSDAEFYQFLLAVHQNMLAHTRPGCAIYVCHSDSAGMIFRRALVDAGWLHKQCVIWVKQSIVMGRQDYHWQHEPILYGWAPGAAHEWHGDRKQSTVWNIDRPSRSEEHPTMKPVELVERALANSAPRAGRVLDTFGGSGTTLIACEKTGRSAFLSEIDPRYCQVIIDRWEKFTGKKATQERDQGPIASA